MASADPKRHSGAGQPPPYEESQGRPLSTSVLVLAQRPRPSAIQI